ncbi:MAG: YggT family protein [Clostridia bacterium]|nr:YggT family protein [Clostridia bacterium]
MENIFRMLGYIVYYFLFALGIALLLRAVLSWFVDDEDSRIMRFLELITEPVVILVRGTMGRLFESIASPIDISYIITVLLVELAAVIVRNII